VSYSIVNNFLPVVVIAWTVYFPKVCCTEVK
jgi:hypothetical protein